MRPRAPIPYRMFDQLRDVMRGFSDRSSPDDRRRAAHSMKEALVHAKMGVQDLRGAVATTERRVTEEREELATVERRLGLAQQINDQETVTIAERFRAQHAEKLAVLETKLMSQQQELNLAERELEEMAGQLRRAMSGLPIDSSNIERDAMREVESSINGDAGSGTLDDEMRAPRMTRAEKEAAAEDRLADLKRRMGK
jgi:vacuolar-type H+-ATPase subunit I/STV1